jgi:histone H3/H4
MDSVIVRSKVKDFVENMSIAADFSEKLNEEVIALIRKAAERARENGRRTVMAKDV